MVQPGAVLPETTMLSIADANNADQMFLFLPGTGGQAIEWSMANSVHFLTKWCCRAKEKLPYIYMCVCFRYPVFRAP